MKRGFTLLIVGLVALAVFLTAREEARLPSETAAPPLKVPIPAEDLLHRTGPPIATGGVPPDIQSAARPKASDEAVRGDEPATPPTSPLAGSPEESLAEKTDPSTTALTRTRVHALLLAIARAIALRAFDQMESFIDGIKGLGPQAVGPLLDVIIHADDTRYPIYAAVILGEMQAERPDPALAEALREYALPYLEDVAARSEDPGLRHAAMVALGKIGDARSFDILVDAVFREEGAPLVDQAARSLTALRGEEVTPALSRLAQGEPDPALRARLVAALAGRKDPAALEALSELAGRDASREVRLEAARGLGALATAEAREVLRDIAAVPGQQDVRAVALAGLGVPGDETDLQFLAGVLRSPAANELRAVAYRSLSRIGTAKAHDALAGFATAARVEGLVSGGNASSAGLRRNDLITRYDGEPVSGPAELASLVGRTRADRTVPVRLLRGGRTVDARVRGGILGLTAGDGVVRD